MSDSFEPAAGWLSGPLGKFFDLNKQTERISKQENRDLSS